MSKRRGPLRCGDMTHNASRNLACTVRGNQGLKPNVDAVRIGKTGQQLKQVAGAGPASGPYNRRAGDEWIKQGAEAGEGGQRCH